MKTLTEQVLEILQDTKRSTLILSEVIRINEFKKAFEQAILKRDTYVIGEDYTEEYCGSICEKQKSSGETCEHIIKNEELKNTRERAEETL